MLLAGGIPNTLGSVFSALWTTPTDPKLFVDRRGCCCCDEVGVVQTVRGKQRHSPFTLPFSDDDRPHVDAGRFSASIFYRHGPVRIKPCRPETGHNYVLSPQDQPREPINLGLFHTLIYHRLSFETWVVCISGKEAGPLLLNGITVYKCIKWGEEYEVLNSLFATLKPKDFRTRRWIGNYDRGWVGYGDARFDEDISVNMAPSNEFSQAISEYVGAIEVWGT